MNQKKEVHLVWSSRLINILINALDYFFYPRMFLPTSIKIDKKQLRKTLFCMTVKWSITSQIHRLGESYRRKKLVKLSNLLRFEKSPSAVDVQDYFDNL